MLRSLFRSFGQARRPAEDRVAVAPQPATKPAMRGPYTYSADGLSTIHDASFLADPLFRHSYRLGAESGHRICSPEDLHIEWRVYVCCWAASHAIQLDGDFVECGVSTGIVSRAVANYVDFGRHARKFWLVDTFEGIPIEQASTQEQSLAQSKNARHYFDCYEDVCSHFSRYGNVRVVKGRVPEVLHEVSADAVCYLHIDMNIAEPEVDAIRYFWHRLTPGALVVFDDYGSLVHAEQKRALDLFADSVNVRILAMPTGQGLLLKPPPSC
jgi:O-methyltransferase